MSFCERFVRRNVAQCGTAASEELHALITSSVSEGEE